VNLPNFEEQLLSRGFARVQRRRVWGLQAFMSGSLRQSGVMVKVFIGAWAGPIVRPGASSAADAVSD
jgi:hypothetical protein